MNLLRLVLFVSLSLALLGPAVAQPPSEKPPEKLAAPKVEIADLEKLLAEPQSELRLVVRRYQADLAALNRRYEIPMSLTTEVRLTRFHSLWLQAVSAIDPDQLGEAGRADWKKLKADIEKNLRELEDEARDYAEIAPLIPFASTIIGLQEARRRMEPIDPAQAAGQVHRMSHEITRTIEVVEEGLKNGSPAFGVPLNQSTLQRSIAALRILRGTLNSWHRFYDGYHPGFTWWLASPYKDAHEALERYAALLTKHARAQKPKDTEDKDPPKSSPPKDKDNPDSSEPVVLIDCDAPIEGVTDDVPDLQELMTFPQSEMRGVIEKFQSDRRSLGRLWMVPGRRPSPRSAERLERVRKFYIDWLAALKKLNFDALSHDAQIDYLLLTTYLNRERQMLDLRAKSDEKSDEEEEQPSPRERGRRQGPIGREALQIALDAEMIPYSPEELIRIAEQEFAWCDAEMLKASREMGFGEEWKKALEKVKTLHVKPGNQPELIRDLAWEAIDFIKKQGHVTVPPLASEIWRMEMMPPERQLVNPFFTGGEVITVSYPTNTMTSEAKRQSMRGNNIHFSRATVHHELIPGHHLQGFINSRYRGYRRMFSTPFWVEGWALYWEMILYDTGFPQSPEDRVGMLFWRMHRCARIIFSLNYHLGKWTPEQCIDFLVDRVGHERDNATAEVRRSFGGRYSPLYQAAYMLGGLQIRAMRKELVDTGKMDPREFHDAILKQNRIPIALVRASLSKQKLTRDYKPDWRFYGAIEGD